MTKKLIEQYVCQNCGTLHPKWSGKCVDCNSWNTLVKEVVDKALSKKTFKSANDLTIKKLEYSEEIFNRTSSGLSEFDRVLGGGIVDGSAILLGGDPGIGKSTLVLQVLTHLTLQAHDVLYISGEESVSQIALRAKRLALDAERINVGSLTDLNDIKVAISEFPTLKCLVIDSIQTIYDSNFENSPGSVSQVRNCTFELIRIAKHSNISLIIIGHVNKDGAIAGPKVLEHMVDTVLYFESDNGNAFRMIRALKNRFGAANEIAIFEMIQSGLIEVANPSKLFMSQNSTPQPGTCIFPGIEGTRPLLLEVQALVVPSFLASPRRSVQGWDANRLAMLIAVINARVGVNLLDKEVYLNIAGGLRISEPAIDLAVVVALISAFRNIAIPFGTVFIGELGLSGEIRSVSHMEARIKEAEKLGFTQAIVPKADYQFQSGLELIQVQHIKDIMKFLA